MGRQPCGGLVASGLLAGRRRKSGWRRRMLLLAAASLRRALCVWWWAWRGKGMSVCCVAQGCFNRTAIQPHHARPKGRAPV
jgi:hypothetical protein